MPHSLEHDTVPEATSGYLGCFTSIFIFCLGVRSPCRITAITQRSSILRERAGERSAS